MNLETAIHIWTLEAKAHGYIGFLVIDGYDRIFLKRKDEALKYRDSHTIIEEVYI